MKTTAGNTYNVKWRRVRATVVVVEKNSKYRMIQKEGLNFVSLYFKIRTSDKYDVKKGKALPLQAWTGPEGSRRLRLPDFKTIGT